MKKYNDFRWIPCDRVPRDVEEYGVYENTAEGRRVLQCAALVALERQSPGCPAGVEHLGMPRDGSALPVIRIE